MLGLRLGFSSSITPLLPPTFGLSKHHGDLVLQRAVSPNVVKCSNNNFSTDDTFKKADLKLRVLVKEEIKSCVVRKPQAPKDFPFEVEDVPDYKFIKFLKLNGRDEGKKFELCAFIPKDLGVIITDKKDPDYGKPMPSFILMYASICDVDGRYILFKWVADRDPDLCFVYEIIVNGVNLEKELVESFNWRLTLSARGVDDSILTDFAMAYLKFRSDRKRLFMLKKLEEFVEFEPKVEDEEIKNAEKKP